MGNTEYMEEGIDPSFFTADNVPPSNWFKFEKVGDKVMGTLVSVESKAGTNNLPDQEVFTLKKPNGDLVKVGIAKHKDYVLARARTAQLGDQLGFQFVKTVPSSIKGMQDAKSIEVYVKKQDLQTSL